MGQYLISEAATQTGFAPATLRYYEQVGLLPEVARTPSGYRLYDERIVQRLRLIARGKALGLSLEEITELSSVWDEDRCVAVQDRLRDLIDRKIGDATSRIAELHAFVADLESARGGLATRTPEAPCDSGCGCTAETETAPRVPVACTLDSDAVTDRLAAWRALVGLATRIEPRPSGVRVRFDPSTDAGGIAALAVQERHCCAFLSFSLAIERDAITLEVHGPADALPVVDALVGVSR